MLIVELKEYKLLNFTNSALSINHYYLKIIPVDWLSESNIKGSTSLILLGAVDELNIESYLMNIQRVFYGFVKNQTIQKQDLMLIL